MFKETNEATPVYEGAAYEAGLSYVDDSQPGLSRRKNGKGFFYLDADGRRVKNKTTLDRIRSLVIPPAWTEVWICATANGHLQATGRDAKSRKQYRYHPLFRQSRDASKFESLISFGAALPKIRTQVRKHLAVRTLSREKVLATLVHLLETTLIRVGNEDYARQNKSFGLTTLKNRHVVVRGPEIKFRFTGKSGKQWALSIRDRRVAKIIRQCQELPGQNLVQYVASDGAIHSVASTDVNEYLREISQLAITAKDFRTWAGTVMAAVRLNEEKFTTQTEAKKLLRSVIADVAVRLGNTPTICRKCYIHPDLVDLYLEGKFSLSVSRGTSKPDTRPRLTPAEAAVMSLLRKTIKKQNRTAR